MAPMKVTLWLAANQGEMGGGEVMLLALAEAARNLGHEVGVVAPSSPTETADAARARGFTTVTLPGRSTRSYLLGLRRWDAKERSGLLWCNGLRPALATAGHADRVVHLHQEPVGRLLQASRVARLGSLCTVVPSADMGRRVPRARVLENWTQSQPQRHRAARGSTDEIVIGYLGRLSSDKGVPVLARATAILRDRGLPVRLLLAGEPRFVDAEDTARVEAALEPIADAVERPGWMDRSAFFDAVDLAVFPSVWAEPFGLVAAEAMAARCPFVVSDAGALPEVVGADYPHIARRDDADSLADTLEAALVAPEPQVVERAFRRWTSRFSPAAGEARLGALLDSIAKGGNAS